MLFADDGALIAHTEEALQRFITCFAEACTEFSLTVWFILKKTPTSWARTSAALPRSILPTTP